jgi:hypothetical protein
LVTACAVGAALLGPPGLFVCEQVCARRFVEARLGGAIRWNPAWPLPLWVSAAMATPVNGPHDSVCVTMCGARVEYWFHRGGAVFATRFVCAAPLDSAEAVKQAERVAVACLAPPPSAVCVESLQSQVPGVSINSKERDAFRATIRVDRPSRYVYRRYELRMDERGRPLLLWKLHTRGAEGAQR